MRDFIRRGCEGDWQVLYARHRDHTFACSNSSTFKTKSKPSPSAATFRLLKIDFFGLFFEEPGPCIKSLGLPELERTFLSGRVRQHFLSSSFGMRVFGIKRSPRLLSFRTSFFPLSHRNLRPFLVTPTMSPPRVLPGQYIKSPPPQLPN